MDELVLKGIMDECDRFRRGDFTEEEKRMFQIASRMGDIAATIIERIALGTYGGEMGDAKDTERGGQSAKLAEAISQVDHGQIGGTNSF